MSNGLIFITVTLALAMICSFIALIASVKRQALKEKKFMKIICLYWSGIQTIVFIWWVWFVNTEILIN